MQPLYPARSLDLISSSGERTPFTVSFGPIYQEGDDFRCKITFDGLPDSPPDMWGYDSLQAFTLALFLYNSIIQIYLDQGSRLVWPGTDQDYDLDDWIVKNTAEQDAAANP